MNITRNPETSAACQVLYAAADTASQMGRHILFHAISRLTGRPAIVIETTWRMTTGQIERLTAVRGHRL